MAEKEYIEREALLQDIAETVIVSAKTGYTNPELKGINKVIGRIQAMPTADVQEVRHGKWLYEDSDIGWTDYKCSACGNIISTVAQDEDLYSYCPYCGAKMDKEAN